MATTATTLTQGARHVSKRLVASYIFDWILIIVIAGIGGAFNRLKNTNNRPFSLQDPSISYPYHEDTVTGGVLIIVGLVAPGVITAAISLLFIPGPTVTSKTPRSLIWRRKLWEWNTAWMGLGLALASAFMATEGLKDLGGKPRPHAIARCNPDLSPESIARWQVGGLGTSISSAVPIMVTSGICQYRDPHGLRDIFASWPSGHSSFSWAGLLYLTLFLCSKFAVAIPFLSPTSSSQLNTSTFDEDPVETAAPTDDTTAPGHHKSHHKSHMLYPPRNQAAAPPIYLLLLAVIVPIGTAFFICVSRWFDFHHHGFDIISGALLGSFCAYFAFRWYHLPIRRGAGWAWGARSRGRAFWLGVGREGYVGDEGWESAAVQKPQKDLEAQNHSHHLTGPGVEDRGSTGELINGPGAVRGESHA